MRTWLLSLGALGLLIGAPERASAQISYGGQRSTRVGDSGGRTTTVGGVGRRENPMAAINQQIQSLQKQAETAFQQVPQTAGGAEGGGGEAEGASASGYRGVLVYGGNRERPPTWRERVDDAKAKLDPKVPRTLLRALRSDDPAEVFAVLSLEAEGKLRFKEDKLVEVLEGARNRLVARAAAVLVGKRRTPTAYAALETHIRLRGPADDSAVKILWAAGPPLGQQVFFERASLANGRDETSLLAIRALALVPGKKITQLLQRLQDDRSPKVRKAAEKAIEMRASAGLPTATEIKPIDYGESYDAILKNAEEVDWNSVYTLPGGEGGDAPPEGEGGGQDG